MINEIYSWMDQVIRHSFSIWLAILLLTFIWGSTVWAVSKWTGWFKAYAKFLKEEEEKRNRR
tara:strand:+ start:9287 stop:9472 length:186 start_codon:yes stop_codon:yes gene_type:complete